MREEKRLKKKKNVYIFIRNSCISGGEGQKPRPEWPSRFPLAASLAFFSYLVYKYSLVYATFVYFTCMAEWVDCAALGGKEEEGTDGWTSAEPVAERQNAVERERTQLNGSPLPAIVCVFINFTRLGLPGIC